MLILGDALECFECNIDGGEPCVLKGPRQGKTITCPEDQDACFKTLGGWFEKIYTVI